MRWGVKFSQASRVPPNHGRSQVRELEAHIRTIGGLEHKPLLEINQIANKTDIALFIHGMADFELQDYELTQAGIEEYADDLAGKLKQIAKAVEILRLDGWSFEVKGANIEAAHPEVTTAAEALTRITRLGVQDDIIDVGERSIGYQTDEHPKPLTCCG